MLCKGLTAPALPAFPGRELHVQARGRMVPMDKELGGPSGTWRLSHSTPLQGKSFRKAVSAVMDDLGIDGKIIENLNILNNLAARGCIINVWKRFISSRVIRGGALVDMSWCWLQMVRREPKMKVHSLIPFIKIF